jgi:PAS domain S-box-containing protein
VREDAETSSVSGVFSADPYIGRDLAAVDWSATPLGHPDEWPQSLQTAVSILLSSRFSMWMAWGPQLTFFCNAAYRRDTLGSKYPWALGQPASEVWAEIWADIGPRIEKVLSTGQATWDAALLLFLERSGYPEETYHTFSYSPLRDDAGQVVGMLCVVSEDTERVIGERRMATLRDLGSDPTVVRTEEQTLAFSARQLGRNARDLPFTLTYLFDDHGAARLAATSGISAGRPDLPSVLSTDDPAGWPLADVARGESVLMELDADRFDSLPNGAWPQPPAQAFVVPLLQQGAGPCGFLVAALNRYRPVDDGYCGFVTLVASHIAAGIGSARAYEAQQRRAEELAELDRAKTTFFSNVSHEFRTPLTLILGPLNELRAGVGQDEAAQRELEVIHRNALRLNKLVNTLLDFSRLEAGRMEAQYQPIDLSAATIELASVFQSAVERAGLVLAVDCPPLGEPVFVDRDMWEKLVLNLLSNALKFTFDGTITVRIRRQGSDAVVTVADTGVGVPAAELSRLFERFHRIENVRARSNEGSGIGLALVSELVGLHGGTITADSAEGAGTTFTIRLPFGSAHLPADAVSAGDVAQASLGSAAPYVHETLRWLPSVDGSAVPGVVEAPPVPGASISPVPGPAARVLIADDNTDMREYLTRLLGAAGYLITAVTDGQEALEAVRVEIPELVISDVMMPRLDGLGLLSALRMDPRTAAVPVLLLTARAGEEASGEGLAAGADDYLVKPFAAADLISRVRANIELARLRNHHARWRTALVDSLQEAFFVCDEHGTVVEINTAFTDIVGYGPEYLPYEPPHPWWPAAETDAVAHRQAADAFTHMVGQQFGSYTIPVTHRDGHRLWAAVSFNHAAEPDTGRRAMVGTFRDVTAEHYTVQRQTALAAVASAIAQAETLEDALARVAREMCNLWVARRVVAATFSADADDFGNTAVPAMVCAGESARWEDLSPRTRQTISAVRDGELLTTDAKVPGSAAIALQHPRGVLVLHVELAEQRPFTREDQTLLTVLAGRLGQGLQRAYQLDQQRETALALQHAILGPARLPAGFAVRYEPASRPLQVGGDWYDVLELDDARIALIVGDCVGHGLAAATVMGQLRSACRALLLEHHSPGSVLTSLDQFAARLPGAQSTTALCAVLNRETGELVYSSAGHPPPILVHADRSVALLEGGRTIPLGWRSNWSRPEARVTLPPRTTLLLYTDGLIERRGSPLDDGIAGAAELVRAGSAVELEELASHIMTRLAPPDGYEDDVAMLLYRQPGPLKVDFVADVTQLAPTRHALRGWLDRAGIGSQQSQDVLVAAGEAVANAVEHGHRDHPDGIVSLRATVDADCLRVTVTDTGQWKAPQQPADNSRGRGLLLMQALMLGVDISSDSNGTTVSMHARITA